MSAPTIRRVQRISPPTTQETDLGRGNIVTILETTVPSLDSASINRLLELRYPSEEFILSNKNPGNFADVVNMLRQTPIDEAIEFLRIIQEPSDIIYQSYIFAAEKENLELEIINLQTKTIVARGIFTCSRCKGNKTISAQKQIRSADEPISTFVKCQTCGLQWRED